MNNFVKIWIDASPTRIALLAPLIFILHVVEEAPLFVSWFNSLVQEGISQALFLQVNAFGLVITTVLAITVAITREKAMVVLFLGWLSFLMFANAIFHIVATLVHDRYAPGVITAVTLYLPYFIWFLIRALRSLELNITTAVAVIALGSAPMVIHGYLIIFEGNRLF